MIFWRQATKNTEKMCFETGLWRKAMVNDININFTVRYVQYLRGRWFVANEKGNFCVRRIWRTSLITDEDSADTPLLPVSSAAPIKTTLYMIFHAPFICLTKIAAFAANHRHSCNFSRKNNGFSLLAGILFKHKRSSIPWMPSTIAEYKAHNLNDGHFFISAIKCDSPERNGAEKNSYFCAAYSILAWIFTSIRRLYEC